MNRPYPKPPFKVSFKVKHIISGEITDVESTVIAIRNGELITIGDVPGVGPLDPEHCELVETLEEPVREGGIISHDLDL